ncbi:MAG: hypothetical protein FJ217_16910, partial [Ignavibacteria bacterium]|nr:hypothetical protein [Ignavibacteria bacterium]
MKQNADNSLIFQAKRLLDEYVIVRSTSPRFAGWTFNSLRDVVYQLESDPTAALQRPEWSEILEGVLEDIVTGRIVTARKRGST